MANDPPAPGAQGDKRILLIIGGGIAAYKSLELIRLLRAQGLGVRVVLTRAAEQFITPLSVSAIAGSKAFGDLFDLGDESQIGHIQLARWANLVVIAPATADLMAKMAAGLADDLASTLLLATDAPVLIAPAMNVRMWQHPAVQRNLARLVADNVMTVGPDSGDMACGEYGPGRMAEPASILAAAQRVLWGGPLAGKRILVTSGATHEPIDAVRYMGNRSSGAQGSAIAQALAQQGAEVVFITGPAQVPPPAHTQVIQVQSAQEMLAAVRGALPAEVAIFAAAVADWRVAQPHRQKIKKQAGTPLALEFVENPDILASVAQLRKGRPALVIGFAAETENLLVNATAKRLRKGCDWIVANDVGAHTGVMGGQDNAVILITAHGAEPWPRMSKHAVGAKLVRRIVAALA